MDFNLTEEQAAYQDAARTFARAEMEPHAEKWDQEKIFPKDVIRKAAEMGFCGVYTREDVGGMGLSRLDAAIIFEELSYACTSTTAYITIHNMVSWMIDAFGPEPLRKEWCSRMVTGEMLGSYCLTEANSGSDAASLKTKAVKEGDHYVVNGSKAFVSGGGETDVLVVMLRTGDDTPKGISALVIPTSLEGISYGENEKKMGWNSQPTRIINFDNVKVPCSNLLGEEGQGFKIAMMGLDGGRLNIGTCSVGTAQSALDAAQKHMLERKQFGKPLAAFQALQFKIADMQTELIAARQMIRLAAFKYDNKLPQATAFCAMAKRFATDLGFQICNDAVQIFGGYGYTKEYKVERHLRDLRVHQILEGTNEIMRVIVSRKVLEEGATEQFR
ncbi:acyl-CoA dehydrogenase [bacterium]|nr:acyl-CoA dehydrogenase [bacterium]